MLKELYEEERQFNLGTKAQLKEVQESLKEVQEAREIAGARIQELEGQLAARGSGGGSLEGVVVSPTPRPGSAAEGFKAETARAVAAKATSDLEALRSEWAALKAALGKAEEREAELKATLGEAEVREAALKAAVEAERHARQESEEHTVATLQEQTVLVASLRQACSELEERAKASEDDKRLAEGRPAELETRVSELEADLLRASAEAAALEARLVQEAELGAASLDAMREDHKAEAQLVATEAAARVAEAEVEAADLRRRLAEVESHLADERRRPREEVSVALEASASASTDKLSVSNEAALAAIQQDLEREREMGASLRAQLESMSARASQLHTMVSELDARCQNAEEASLAAKSGEARACREAEDLGLKIAALAGELASERERGEMAVVREREKGEVALAMERERGEAALEQRNAFWKQEVSLFVPFPLDYLNRHPSLILPTV